MWSPTGNRIGNNLTVLGVYVKDDYDQINVNPPTGRRFWVTTNGADYGAELVPSPFGSGYMNHSFNATCTYDTGTQSWKAGIWGSSLYNDLNSSALELNITSDLFSIVQYPDGQSFDQGRFPGAVYTQQTDAVTCNEAQLDTAEHRIFITKLSILQFKEVLWLPFRLHEMEAKG